ncbi:MAG: hypothetical protein Q9180_007912, partial [Flavoplaca navasiana]
SQASATLPRFFTSNSSSQANDSQRLESESGSPSTASSATATAGNTGEDDMSLRQRRSGVPDPSDSQNMALETQPPSQENKKYMRFFPDVPRTILRPASEAFLPQPTWVQRTLRYLEDLGLIPRDVIGHAVPFTESGEFDWANASFYWRICYWMDSTFGTDICGLKDD